ncbi:ATP-dependent DNA helicase RecG [Candidatus Falkowbacteria bacterium]|nr:ATP-dependent DNA helicase RecG [Candidatus Falkowbacteria bacterium]
MITLNTPVSELTRVGKTTASRLKRLGIESALDLLWHFPFRYDDYSKVLPIRGLQAGQGVTIKVRIEMIENKRSRAKRKILIEAMVADEAGDRMKVIWFNQSYLAKILHQGDWVYLAGKIDYGDWGLQMTNPSYELVRGGETTHTGRLVPIYPVTANLTEKQVRFLTKLVMPLAGQVEDFLPDEVKQELGLIDLGSALCYIHFPEDSGQLEQARKRLKFDELFIIQLQAQRARAALTKLSAPKIEFCEQETKSFVESLPFKLTDAQRKSSWEIIKDLGKGQPMNRMLEGDVGSGKTVVAVIVGLNVIWSGGQVILMAPTEILAKQHYENIKKILKYNKINPREQTGEKLDKPKRVNVGILTRTEKKVRTNKDGIITSDFIIGTHAILQDKVKFNKLGLVIIDEQHRFGVEQRKTLRDKDTTKTTPHLLSMTATPIPRSLALSLYGDLDLSVIDQMPANRKKIITKVIDPANRGKAYDFIHEQIKNGRQIFVVCPLIDPFDSPLDAAQGSLKASAPPRSRSWSLREVKSAEEEYEKIDKQIFPHLRVGLLHGRLKPKEKEQVRTDFWKGRLDILVATAVVEVGIDVANASVMMIEGSERFGLAQLHQFRGRVGRSEHQSYCFLFTDSNTDKTKKRLEALVVSKNGFELAEKDLEFRGPGEVYGKSQSGFFTNLRIAKLTDYDIIKQAREMAEKLVLVDAELSRYPLLKDKVRVFEREVHLE